MITTTLSGKGQIVIPKSLRESRRWRPGTRFIVEEITSGILLKPADISAHQPGGWTWLHRLPGTSHQCAGHGAGDSRGYPQALAERKNGMIALDTNVWVRYVTNDEPDQAKRALAILAGAEEIFVAKTTLLELEWVLRAAYELSAAAIIRALRQILGLPNVQIEMPDQLEKAIYYYEKGLDFADALHLASSPEGVSFYTFDTAFIKRAR